MTDYQFFQGSFPAGFTKHFPESLFNKAEHRQLQSKGKWISFYLLFEEKKQIEGAFHVHLNEKEATSPYKAPFGSFEFSKNVPQRVLIEFIKFVEDSLLHEGVIQFTIKMPPVAYSSDIISLQQTLLANRGFKISLTEVGSVIQVDDRDFIDLIRDTERHVLNQFKKKEFTCSRVSIDKLEKVYSFIARHQASKGYSLSMSFEQLYETVDTFKDDFFLFIAKDQNQIIGASVSVRVQNHVLYNFYIAHDAVYNRYSPVIAIIEALYYFCKERNFMILDLGTSMLNKEPNTSLLNFKRRLGGVDTEKLTLSKKLV